MSKLILTKSLKSRGDSIATPRALRAFRDSKDREYTSIVLTREQVESLIEAATEALATGEQSAVLSIHAQIKDSVNGPFASAFMTLSAMAPREEQQNTGPKARFQPKAKGSYTQANRGQGAAQSVNSVKAKLGY